MTGCRPSSGQSDNLGLPQNEKQTDLIGSLNDYFYTFNQPNGNEQLDKITRLKLPNYISGRVRDPPSPFPPTGCRCLLNQTPLFVLIALV